MQEFIARLSVPRLTLGHVRPLTYDVIFEPLQSRTARKLDIFADECKWITRDNYFFQQTILLTIPFYVFLDADFESDIVKFEFEKVYPHVQLENFEFGPILNIFASYIYVLMEPGQNGPWV